MNRKARKAWAADMGPCYDFCACRLCWRGWSGISFFTKLRWRIYHIRKHGWNG